MVIKQKFMKIEIVAGGHVRGKDTSSHTRWTTEEVAAGSGTEMADETMYNWMNCYSS